MTSENHHKNIDQHSGVETTGHEWDGIKELNNPAPRWWLWIFFITCIWSFGYWVVYPAWPTLSGDGFRGGTIGNSDWTQYNELKEQQQEILVRKENYLKRLRSSSFEHILNDSELYTFAVTGGKTVFKDNCATCHGTGGAGGNGYPNLNDDDWLWGGSVDTIYETIKYGIRGSHDETRTSQMPAFGQMLPKKEISEIASYILSLSDKNYASKKGEQLYKENCASCHGEGAQGDYAYGAPNLADAIWLYSEGTKEAIAAQILEPKHGIMPTWEGRLDEDTIRLLAVYVHSLGGGE